MDRVKLYEDEVSLFSRFQIEHQIESAFSREVRLPSGGAIVIDHTEALVSIDVNSSRATKGSDIEHTAFNTNIEAAEEVAKQLRLRDLAGLVVIDFIDMTLESNREAVMRRLIECLGRDRTKHQVAEVTSLGLVQMTRKRVGQGLIEAFSTTCESCGGRGIHIHNEPVRKVALEKDMEQRYVPQLEDEDESPESDENVSRDESSNDSESNQNDHEESGSKPGKRRRRAVSSGVITPV